MTTKLISFERVDKMIIVGLWDKVISD